MTGKLLEGLGNKAKALSGDSSSDDEKKAMLTKAQNEEPDDTPLGPGKKKYWACSLYPHPLPSWLPQRFAICVLAHLGFVLLYVMRSNMSIAIVRMTSPYLVVEGDHLAAKTDFDWNLREQGIILSSFFFGYILTQIPGGYLAARWGGRKTFGLGLFLASLVSVLTPVFGRLGFYGFVVARILCGVFEGVTYPAIHAMWNRWAPPLERASLVSGAFAGAYLGASLSMAQFVSSDSAMSWESIFYLSGFYALVWSIIWFSWGAEDPEVDPMVTERELIYLNETIGTSQTKHRLDIPWIKILLSPPVWAINFCHFAANWGFYTILTELPTFLSSALHYDVKSLAPAASLPFLAMAVSAAFGGCVIDNTIHRYLSTTNTRKFTVCFTFLAQMMFFFLTGKSTERVIVYIIGALFFAGLSWAGFSVNHLDIAPEYASVLLGISNTIGTIPGIVSPLLTGYLVENKDDPEDWSVVFLIAGYIYICAGAFYAAFGSGELQDWANPNESQKLKLQHKQTEDAKIESGSGTE